MDVTKQLCLVVFCLIINVLRLVAQTSIGIQVGATHNRLDFNSDKNRLVYTAGYGEVVQLTLSTHINNWLYLESSPGMIKKNYRIINGNVIYQDINNNYLQLPFGIGGRLNISKKLILSNSIGIYYAYWLTSKINGTAPNAFEISTSSEGTELIKAEHVSYKSIFNQYDRRSEFGWMVSTGMHYRIVSNLGCSVNGSYFRSLTSQRVGIMEMRSPRFNETIALTFGVLLFY
uniref:outer membrane beta-barrel protein n=1 Tax=Pedobacter schmidteae TaxID=2201271 RepID=UPI000EB06084|nr:outer membrane beta-barrel protein [Pedobacter schmidteae]